MATKTVAVRNSALLIGRCENRFCQNPGSHIASSKLRNVTTKGNAHCAFSKHISDYSPKQSWSPPLPGSQKYRAYPDAPSRWYSWLPVAGRVLFLWRPQVGP